MLLEMRCPELRQGCSLSVQIQTAVWIACAGPQHVLFTPRRTFPYRLHHLCSHSWSRYQKAVCMSPASLRAGAGRKYKVWCRSREPEQASGSPSHRYRQLGTARESCLLFFSLPLGFFMTLFKILKPRHSQTPTHLLGVPNAQAPFATTGPLCHLQ